MTRNGVTELAQKIIPKVETAVSATEIFCVIRLRNLVFYINNVIQKQDATDIQGMGVNNCCQYLTVQEDLSSLCIISLFLLSVNAFWEIYVCLLQAEAMDVNFLPFIYYILALVCLFENLVSQ